jgi:MFS family permease
VPPRAFTTAFAVCLFLVIVAAKWATFDRFGSPMPDWDQWDAEAGEVFIPWYGSDQFLTHLFYPHNEHRVVLTKLQNLTLGIVNGQWDSRLEAATNAMLHAALAVALWFASRRWLTGRWHAPLIVLLAALFGLPVAWQNVLGGFHSQQYWLVGLSFAAIVTLPFSPAWSSPWWLGALAAIAVMGSMGSGLLAAAVALAVVLWRWQRREIGFRDVWPTVALGLALIAAGFLTRVDVAWHQHMKVKTVHDFVFSIVHSLQWPWRDRDWAAAVLWLPWGLAAWRVWKSKPVPVNSSSPDPFVRCAGPAIVALGGWVLVQLAATAFARGAGAGYPASRYMDTLSFGAALNGLALAWLLTTPADQRALRLSLHAFGLAWLVTLGLGLHFLLAGVLGSELPDAKLYYTKAEGHMRRYLATDDPKTLAQPDIPYPSAQGLIDRLIEPSLRNMMPVPIRLPLTLVPLTASDPGFAINDARYTNPESPPRLGLSPATPPLDYAPSWGSYGATAPARTPTGAWQSQPISPARRPGSWLRFETAGQLGEPGVALELHEAASGALLAIVRPSKPPGDCWRSAYVPAPRVPYTVVARDHDPARWFAFSGPVEMGPLSFWARQANRHSLLLLYGSLAATLLLAAYAFAQSRRPAAPAPAASV